MIRLSRFGSPPSFKRAIALSNSLWVIAPVATAGAVKVRIMSLILGVVSCNMKPFDTHFRQLTTFLFKSFFNITNVNTICIYTRLTTVESDLNQVVD